MSQQKIEEVFKETRIGFYEAVLVRPRCSRCGSDECNKGILHNVRIGGFMMTIFSIDCKNEDRIKNIPVHNYDLVNIIKKLG